MGVILIVVDHHQSKEDFSQLPNVEVVRGSSLEAFYANANVLLDRDVDLVVSDQDPDGLTSTIIYYLNRLSKRNFQCTRKALNIEDVQQLEAQGIHTVLALDWWPYRYSALEKFEKVILIIPQLSGLPNVNTSEIVFQSLDTSNMFARDLSAIGTVCDYLVESASKKMADVVYDYPTLFFDLLPLVVKKSLDKYNVRQSKFAELEQMFWAPYVIDGEDGCVRFAELILSNAPFSLNELFQESKNPAVQYVRQVFQRLQESLKKEWQHFEATKQEKAMLVLYEPSDGKENFTSFFANNLSDRFPEKITVVKSRSRDAPIQVKYSLRRRDLNVNLGLILEELQCGGGGHPEAAGVAGIFDTETFEQKLIAKIEEHLQKSV